MTHKFLLTVIVILNAIQGFSQDTLRFTNKETLAVKVSEIGIHDIKYRRMDNIDGPQYIVSKKDITYIKFANGQVDSIKVLAEAVATPSMAYKPEIMNDYKSMDASKIIIGRTRLIYKEHGLNDTKLLGLIQAVPNNDNKLKLMREYVAMKSYKSTQVTAGFVGLGLGLLSPVVGGVLMSQNLNTSSSTLGGSGVGYLLGGVGTGVVVGVTGAVISSIYKAKRVKKRNELAEMYNALK